MSSESFFREIFTSFCRSLFKVLGFGLGLLLLFVAAGAFMSGRDGPPPRASVRVLANHDWKVEPFSNETPTILRIDMTGAIGLEHHLTKDEVRLQLMESVDGQLKKGQVKGILITINSPGGSAEQSDAIYTLIKAYKERYNVPVQAFVQGLCASGGMYVACSADKVYATPDSLIGHVGVLFSPPFFNVTTLMNRLGIKSETLSAGKDKDSMNPFRPWKEDEGQQFRYIIDFMYNRFVDVVAENRPKLTAEALIEQGARIWPAPDAENLGYIDARVDSIDQMLQNFSTELGIQDNYQYVILERHDFVYTLFGPHGLFNFSNIFSNKVEHSIRLPGEIDPELCGKPLYMYQP